MQTWQAIVLTLGIFFVSLFLPPQVMFVIVFGTALWAAIDSSPLELHRYKTGIACKPFLLFVACALLWIVAFPWYLSARYKIKNGTLALKG
jgi:hypothetical protein